MSIKEMKQAVNLLSNEWNLGKKESGAKGNICAWIYLFEILSESEKIITYKENNKLIGFGGYSKKNSNKNLFRKKFYNFIGKILLNSKKIKNKEELKKYYDNYSYLPEELEKDYEGEVTILIVNNNHRKKGIGKYLLLKIFEEAKKDNLKKLYILSDESCSYSFYEKLGCKMIYETNIYNIEKQNVGKKIFEKAFVYEKQLK